MQIDLVILGSIIRCNRWDESCEMEGRWTNVISLGELKLGQISSNENLIVWFDYIWMGFAGLILMEATMQNPNLSWDMLRKLIPFHLSVGPFLHMWHRETPRIFTGTTVPSGLSNCPYTTQLDIFSSKFLLISLIQYRLYELGDVNHNGRRDLAKFRVISSVNASPNALMQP